jgi:hypothetical protein
VDTGSKFYPARAVTARFSCIFGEILKMVFSLCATAATPAVDENCVERSGSTAADAHRLRRDKRFVNGIFARAKQFFCGCVVLPGFLVLTTAGCGDRPITTISAMTQGTAVMAIDLSTPAHAQVLPEGVTLSVAKNAWTAMVFRVDCSQLPARPVLRLASLNASISAAAFQVLPVPVDQNDAEYIRQTGDRGDAGSVPRVLLPITIKDGAVDLSTLREPIAPASAGHRPTHGPVLLWIDLHTTAQTPAGNYAGMCQLIDARGGESAGAVPVRLAVENITLPAEPNLHFAAPLDWDTLAAASPDLFASVTPRLLHRGDPRSAPAIGLLDDCIQLAHENKTDVYVPRLAPIVKWPLARMPEVDWSSFDSVVGPWFNATAFTDHVPMGFWPLPAQQAFDGFDLASRCEYWQLAAGHFDRRSWLDRSPVVLSADSHSPVNDAGAILMSAEARKILSSYPRISVRVPMQEDQVQLESPANSDGIALASTSRLSTATPGLVSPCPIRNWPDNALPPRHWIDADSTGSFSEQGIRMLAWLAFSRDASLVQFTSTLPMDDSRPGRPGAASDHIALLYPGQWFGVNAPLATLQLRWIRQAEQDYEYLYLASQHNDRAAALKMCQCITRPVQLQPAQDAQPVFDLLAGSTDTRACAEARTLLIDRIQRPSSSPSATDPVELQSLRWFAEHEHPTLLASRVQWMWNLSPDSSAASLNLPNREAGDDIDAIVSMDLYNPADSTPQDSTLMWTGAGPAWKIAPDPVEVPPLARYQVRSITTRARFDLNDIKSSVHEPVTLSYVDGYNGRILPCKMMLPVAVSQRREQPIRIDGSLDEWFPIDAIQFQQPLVKMVDRPSLQSPNLQLADQPTSIFSAWSEDNFYLAFRLAGVTAADLRATRNFVEYDHGRAWGEDLCELLIQPIYIDNSTGPTLHIVAKPSGEWVEQQTTPNGKWEPFEAGGVRYASGVDARKQVWRGELAIPWRAIQSPRHGRPALLRFNFIQHQNSTGQSASWAGPIDQSRDGNIAGLVVLKEP